MQLSQESPPFSRQEQFPLPGMSSGLSLLLHPGDFSRSLLSLPMFTLSMNPQAALVAHPQGFHKLSSHWIYFCVSLPPVDHESLQARMGMLTSDATAPSTAPHSKQLLDTILLGGRMAPGVLLQILSLFFFYLWWILSYFEMKQPWVYMCSPSQSPLPPPSPPVPSRFSQCTRSERLSHASNLGW